MKTLTMFKGLPGSGKDTIAKEMMDKNSHMYKRVNKDDLREMLDNKKWSGDNEKFIIHVRDLIIEEALKSGKHVLCTDTNLDPKHEKTLQRIAKENDTQFIIKDLTDIPVEECIKRDLTRLNSVGKDVIMSMYKKYIKPISNTTVEEYSFKKGLPECCLIDLDGTLAQFGNKNPYDRDFENDVVTNSVKFIINRMVQSPHFFVIIVSGRSSKFDIVTRQWLINNFISYDALYMRKEGDLRKDVIVKEEIFNTNIKDKYNVRFVIDDRNSVVEFWRSLGLTCLQVNEGDF